MVQRLGGDGQQRAVGHRAVHARLAGQPGDLAAAVVEGVHVPLGRLRCRAEDRRPARRARHAGDLQAGRRHRLVADEQPVGVGGVRAVQQRAVRQDRRRAGDELQPVRVGVGAQQPGRAGLRVDGPVLAAAVIAGVQRQQRRRPRPTGRPGDRAARRRGRRRPWSGRPGRPAAARRPGWPCRRTGNAGGPAPVPRPRDRPATRMRPRAR